MPERGTPVSRTSVSYSGPERIYDLDRGTTQIVKRRYVIVTEGEVTGYTRRGSWDHVPADWPEKDAT